MFGFGKRKPGNAPPPVDATDADQRYIEALLTIVHSHWPDLEEAEIIAAQIALFASVELEVVAPQFKDGYTPVQRAIAAAMYVSISKSGISHLGKDSLRSIIEGSRDFAHYSGEGKFYNDIGKALGIL